MTSPDAGRESPERVAFVCARSFRKDDAGNLVGFRDDLARARDTLGLGDVVWLHMGGVNAANRHEFMQYCGEHGYTVFDVWGYVPGNRPSPEKWYLQAFGEFAPTEDDHRETLRLLHGRFLGYDIGEQDSRYLMIFAPHAPVASLDRVEQYRRQYDFFARMRRDLRGDFSVLAGTTNIHHLARDAGCRTIGGEAIQIHPNLNVWQAFIRGASRQYGVPWTGTVSVFNAFGYRAAVDDRVDDFGMEAGRTRGPSDSLLRRGFHYLYESGASLMGFEQFVQEDGALTPVGEIQREVMALGERRRRLAAPVAILLDFFQGWQPPRNAVNRETHRVWGELPYDEDDFRVDALFDFLFPGYSDGPVFRDERGFLVATPYGETVDVLLSDVRPEILDAYRLVIIPGRLRLDAELTAKLIRFMRRGGRVVQGAEEALRHPNLVPVQRWLEPAFEREHVNTYEKSLPAPFTLTAEARATLDRELRRAIPFTVEGEAQVFVNDAGLVAMNHARAPREVAVPEAGFRRTLAPGEIVRAPFVLPETTFPPARPVPDGPRLLAALRVDNWRERLMRIPSFVHYFSGVVVGAAELLRLAEAEVAIQAEFFRTRRLAVAACDMSDCFSHYPGLSMLGTGTATAEEALAAVRETVRRMAVLGCRDVIVPTQKNGELVTTEAVALARIGDFLRRCAALDVTLHIAVLPHRFGDGVTAMRERLAAWGLAGKVRLYVDTGALLTCRAYGDSIKHGYPKQDGEPRDCFPKDYALLDEPRDRGGLADILAAAAAEIALLGISAPLRDFAGRLVNAHLTPADSPFAGEIRAAVAALPNARPVVDLDGFNWDALFTTWQWTTASEWSGANSASPTSPPASTPCCAAWASPP